jgi:sulfate-transporting ATPase
VVEWILELDRGNAYPFKGNYSEWLEAKEKRLEQEEKSDSSRASARSQQELEWVRASPKARQAKSKARLRPSTPGGEAGAKQARPERDRIPPGPRLGDKVIEVHGIKKSFGDKLLYENLSFSMPPGAIVGIVGANGAGKTTLFRMIAGQEKPDSGQIDGGRDRQAHVRRSVARLARPGEHGLQGDRRAAPRRSTSVGRTESRRAVLRLVQLQGLRPAEEGEEPLGR